MELKPESRALSGVRFLVTAGPTREALDPVRYLSNHSSGKMGFAIANLLHSAGADVHLVTGPVSLQTVLPEEQITRVESALEMFEACEARFGEIDIGIFAAAVADYRPAETSAKKIKRSNGSVMLELVPNPDIAAAFGRVKKARQLSIGFALETDNLLRNAHIKLKKKNLDFIVINSACEPDSGFGTDTNRISILDSSGSIEDFPLKQKSEVAGDILGRIIALYLLKAA